MLRRVVALVLAGALAACGDAAPAAAGPPADVKGRPFLVPKAKAPPPDIPLVGDLDAPKPEDVPPLVPVAAPAPAAHAAPKTDAEESLTFDDLADFEVPAFVDAKAKLDVPQKVLALSGRKVAVDGYMMPLSYEAGGAKKFLLMRYKFGCCYAVAPRINEWIEVTMERGVADYMPDTIATVWGVLEVKREEQHGITGLYRMTATRSELTEAR